MPALSRGTFLQWLGAEGTLGAVQPWVSSTTTPLLDPAGGRDALQGFFHLFEIQRCVLAAGFTVPAAPRAPHPAMASRELRAQWVTSVPRAPGAQCRVPLAPTCPIPTGSSASLAQRVTTVCLLRSHGRVPRVSWIHTEIAWFVLGSPSSADSHLLCLFQGISVPRARLFPSPVQQDPTTLH